MRDLQDENEKLKQQVSLYLVHVYKNKL